MKNIKSYVFGLLLTLLFTNQALALDSTTLLNNGPSSEKLDLVFLGDGYTAQEMDLYHRDIQKFMDYLLSGAGPFKDYKNFFNIHRVDVISNQSGVDNHCTGTFVDTALDAGYYSTGSDCRALFAYNIGKIADASSYAPAADKIIIITNSEMYGGAAYLGGYGVFYHGSEGPEVMIHEMGHSIGMLADEYYDYEATYNGSEPFPRNATINTDRETLKWGRWVLPTTELPTLTRGFGVAGTWEGCMYSHYGIYRPTLQSKMQFLYEPFEQVNYEVLVDEIMNFVPADTSVPSSEVNPNYCGGAMNLPNLAFTLTAADPESYVLAYRFSNNATFSDTAWIMANNQPNFTQLLPSTMTAGDGVKTFYYEVENGYGLVTSHSCIVTLDTVLPGPPGKPSAPSPNQGTFTLAWPVATDVGTGVDYYEVYRSNDGGSSFAQVNIVSGPSTGENVPNGSYIYKIRAKDKAGNLGAYSPNSDVITVGIVAYSLTATSTVNPGDNIEVSWTAPAGSSKTDWIGLYKVGAGDKADLARVSTKGKSTGTTNFIAPVKLGEYELRYFTNNTYTQVAVSNTVTVEEKQKVYTVTATPSVHGGGKISASWTAPKGSSTTDWIGLYKIGAADKAPIAWVFTQGKRNGTTNFTAPSKSGTYELRYFTNNTYKQVAVSNSIRVF